MRISKATIKPREDINWETPKTKIEHVYLAVLLWQDIWINKYEFKQESKYYKYIKNMYGLCPLCECYSCPECPLERCIRAGGLFYEWIADRKPSTALLIYRKCLKKYNELNKP